MKVICDHAGTENCKDALEYHFYTRTCIHKTPHTEIDNFCNDGTCISTNMKIKVKCIPYQEEEDDKTNRNK